MYIYIFHCVISEQIPLAVLTDNSGQFREKKIHPCSSRLNTIHKVASRLHGQHSRNYPVVWSLVPYGNVLVDFLVFRIEVPVINMWRREKGFRHERMTLKACRCTNYNDPSSLSEDYTSNCSQSIFELNGEFPSSFILLLSPVPLKLEKHCTVSCITECFPFVL